MKNLANFIESSNLSEVDLQKVETMIPPFILDKESTMSSLTMKLNIGLSKDETS